MRFKNAVHAHEGSEKEKVAAMKLQFDDETNRIFVETMLSCVMRGGGVEGVLGTILCYV